MAQTANQREDRVSTTPAKPAVTPKSTTATPATKAAVDASIAATNAKINAATVPVKTYLESQGINVNPNTGFYEEPKKSTGGTGEAIAPTGGGVTPTVVSTYTDAQGNRIAVMSDGTTRNLGSTVNESAQVNAITNLTKLFTSYGLGSEIATAIADLVKKGYDGDTISLIAQDPKSTDPLSVAYQKRFAGNAGRIKAGLAPYDPSTYLNVERAFAEAVKAAGLPSGFYDNQSDWADWIGKGVSPAEATRRVNLASDVLVNKDPSYLDQMQNLYGLDKSHALAYLLDSDKALPLIEKQVNAVKFAAAAERAGMGVNKTLAEQYADLGITESQATKGFQTIAEQQAERQRLAALQGLDVAKVGEQLISSEFGGPNAAFAKSSLEQATRGETAAFSGSAGAGKGSLGVEETGIL